MPIYEYTCQQCHERIENFAKFSDRPLVVCPHCGGELVRIFSGVNIAFKGKGFYRNDSQRSGVKGDGPPKKVSPDKTTSTS